MAIRQTVTSVAGQIRKGGLTKTGRSRVVELDSRTVAMLRSLWARQAQERLLVRVAYRDSGFVFCHPDGRPYHPEQVQQLLDDPNGHPAAPVVLAGAAFLRAMLATGPVQPVGKPGLSSFATALQKGGADHTGDVKDITSWAGQRNEAAHGEFDKLSRPRAQIMVDSVNLFMRQKGPSSP